MSSTLGDRLLWRDGDVQISQCAFCHHKRADATCAAFPGGIPAPILSNERSHADPVEGDNGIRLEPIEIAADLFERVTGLDWPPYAVSHTHLDVLIEHAGAAGALTPELAAALLRAYLLMPGGQADADGGLSITAATDAEGNPYIPVFTSIPRLEAFCGPDAQRIRFRLDNFRAGFGDTPLVLNPGTAGALVFDPADAWRLGGGQASPPLG